MVVQLGIVENLLEDVVDLVDGQRQGRLLLATVESSLGFRQGPLVHRGWECTRNPFLESHKNREELERAFPEAQREAQVQKLFFG